MKKTVFLLISILMIFTVFSMANGITSQTVINQKTVDQINAYNAAHELPWTAKLNTKFEGKTIQELSVLNGLKRLPKQIMMAMITRHLTTTDNMIMSSYTLFNPLTMDESSIPSNYDLRDVSGVSYVTPIKDQGWHGTCWAFSTAETLESAMMMQGVVGDYPSLGATPILSTQFISYHDVDWDLLSSNNWWSIQDSNYDGGGSQYFAMYNSIRYGTPPAVDFPYQAYENTPWISWNPQNPDWQKDLVHTTGTMLLLGAPEELYYFNVDYDHYIKAIKTMIMKYGSVSVGFSVPASFFSYSSGIFVAPATPTYVGGHAVQIVGWEDNVTANGVTYPTVWIVRNSWGTTWGMNGYWMQPAVTPAEYASGNVPAWKFATAGWWFYSPVFSPKNLDWEAADFNNDGVVNMDDYNMLVNALNEANPSASTIAKYDIGIPKDKRIDGNDVAEFMYFWNMAAAAGQ